jgi:hypothetical protein
LRRQLALRVPFAGLVAVGLATAPDALGAIITDTEVFSLTQPLTSASASPAQSITLTPDLFSSSLGTLTSVRLILDSAWTNAASISASNALGGALSGGASNLAKFDARLLTPFSSDPLFATSDQVTATCQGAGSCADTANSAGDLDGSLVALALNVPSFVGVGTFQVQMDLGIGVSANCTGASLACSGLGSASWSGSFTVEYTYDPANGTAVPEPASAALLGGGLLALAALRRRQRA